MIITNQQTTAKIQTTMFMMKKTSNELCSVAAAKDNATIARRSSSRLKMTQTI